MLNNKQKYLQIALNGTLKDAKLIIDQIPSDKRIIIEAGTPLIKRYGLEGIKQIRNWWEMKIFGIPEVPKTTGFKSSSLLMNLLLKLIEQKRKREIAQPVKDKNIFNPYIVADLKCMDRGETEVKLAKSAGADAAVCLGQAPIETIDAFIENCKKNNLDAMIDMMNVEFPLNILRQLKEPPEVVILHRGVDEETFNPESEIPFHEIQRIKGEYDIMIAVAGGDTFQEVQRAVFNDADIVIVWKSFYQSTAETAKIAEEFLKEVV
ncbi:MAG: orotidine 5'-phosphate decarboxylase / HUMPS family protein [Patescibacteria group bacterium]